ncbi:MAG: YceI family protein [Planctomycetota bacterium]|nr:YceI family protein [Planctomycetota bacterium]
MKNLKNLKNLKSQRVLLFGLVAASCLLVATWNPGASATTVAGDTFVVDPVHSCLIFRIRFAGMSSFYGRFNEWSGKFVFDEKSPESSRFEFTVKAASIDSGNTRRDGHLRSPDFLSAKEHPEIKFVTKKLEKTGKNTFKVTGNLTLRGVTKEVTGEATYGGQKTDRDGLRAGFDGSLKFRRADFGVTFGPGRLGSEVTILLGVNGLKQ